MAGNVTVDRTIVRAVTVFAMLNLLVTLNNTPSRSWMYPAGLGALGCVLLTLSVLASLRDCFRPVPTWRGIRVLTYISLGLMAAHCLTVRDLSPRDYPPLLHACGVIILTAAAAFPLPTGCVLMGTYACLLYTSDAADERSSVDLGGCRLIKKKKKNNNCTGGLQDKTI